MISSDNSITSLPDKKLAALFKSGDDRAFNELVFRHIGTIGHIASRFSAGGYEHSDFVQEGLLGLMSACLSYDETGATAFRDTVRLAAGGRPSAFRRAAVLWQMALDDTLNPVYEAAGNERRQAIAAWRITLDSLAPAEKSLLALMYGDRSATAEEQLMNLYRDAALNTEHVR